MFAVLQKTGYARYEDLPLKTRAGVKIEVKFVSNTYDVSGVKMIQCNIRDISDRKRAELALLNYHEQLDIALSNTVELATTNPHIVSEAVSSSTRFSAIFTSICAASSPSGSAPIASAS